MSKVLDVIRKVAPTIATALGGPLAGLATHTLGGVLLGKDDASADEINEYILGHTNPEVLLKLKTAEIELQKHLGQLDIDMAELGYKSSRLHVEDRVSARNMASITKSRATAIIAGCVLFAFAGILAMLFVVEVPEASRPVLYVLIGALATALTQVMNFYFGSSEGSKVKDTQISQMVAASDDMRGKLQTYMAEKPGVEVNEIDAQTVKVEG